jgi:hypothetical protein
MFDGKTIAIIGLMTVFVILAILWHRSNVRKLEEAEQKLLADIKANPELYFVYEGGTKPNPPDLEQPTDETGE